MSLKHVFSFTVTRKDQVSVLNHELSVISLVTWARTSIKELLDE